jgi:hypothetical protein
VDKPFPTAGLVMSEASWMTDDNNNLGSFS